MNKLFQTGIAITPPESKTVIAEVWPMEKDDGTEDLYRIEKDAVALANARLIAAAPDLLEACRLTRRAFWHIPLPSDEESKAYRDLSAAHGKLVAAIQKATGLNQ